MLSSLEISASGLEARRVWMNTIAENISNAETTRDEFGLPNPYRRQRTVLAVDPHGGAAGVRVQSVVADPSPLHVRHEPGHPDADEHGRVRYPNVNVVHEMVDMLMASRAYEANVTAMDATKSMMASAMRIIG
jgi:flagellar basal-body rod protein FlgC